MACLKMIVVRSGGQARKVGCGKCAFCLQQKRSQWMFRIYHEMRCQLYPGWFLTLTYDEKHVPRTAGGRLSLRFYDVQLFFKRLRKAKHYVKYVCVGEYGSDTARPHYHMLLWTSATPQQLQDEWKSSKDNTPLGRIHFGSLTMKSAMYTLKYIIQPKVNEDEKYLEKEHRREKTRAQFSRGIGISYLSRRVYDWHTRDFDAPRFTSVVDGREVALPRYYCQKIFTKFQRERETHRLKWQSIRAFRKEMREHIELFRKAGKVAPPFRPYYDELRKEQARRIIQSTKYGELL